MPAHRAPEITAFLARHSATYQIGWVPSYASNLNPVELCNNAVKRDLRNALPNSVGELCRGVQRSFRRLGQCTALLHRFFEHTGLDVS